MATPAAIRTDEHIQKDVLDELKWDARVQPNEIGVAVKDGVVTLNGLGGLLRQALGCRRKPSTASLA